MRRFINYQVFLLIALMAVSAAGWQAESKKEPLPTVDQVLDRYIDAVGGSAAVEKLSTRICSGIVTTDLSSRNHPIYEEHYFETFSKSPDKFYTITYTDAGTHERGFDGKKGWVKDKCGVRSDDSAGERRLDWLLNPQNVLEIKTYFPDLVVKGIQKVRGMAIYELESPELHRPLFFDIETGLLVGFGHNCEIHDYREIDGVMFPHRVLMSRKGGSTVYKFEKIEHNLSVDDTLFVAPE